MSIKDQWVVEAYDTYGKRDPKRVLKDFVGKLGIKSAREKELELRLADIQASMQQALASYGRPAQLIMNPNDLKAYQKAFSKKP